MRIWARSLERVAVFVVWIDQKDAQIRAHLKDGAQQYRDPADLPTPVLPRSAKCLPSMSSTLMAASIEASCCGLPILMIAAPQVPNTMRRLSLLERRAASPIIG